MQDESWPIPIVTIVTYVILF